MSALPRQRFRILGWMLAIAGSALALAPFACTGAKPHAVAQRITNRRQLVGGPDSLGDVGDISLSNGKVRFVIQGITDKSNFSRGWGVYGGSLLDADLVRPTVTNNGQPTGNDHFGEMFPALFLEAISPTSVEVGNTGEDGKPATVVVKGSGAPFITLARQLLGLAGLDFTADPNQDGLVLTNTYSLGPDDQFLTMTTTIAPPPDATGPLSISAASLLGINIAIPFGSVILFGNQNNVFIPGVGFDLYYGLQDSYKEQSTLPALTGLMTDLIATQAPGVSYGVAIQPPSPDALDTSYVYKNKQSFAQFSSTYNKEHPLEQQIPAEQQMLVPFVASSFTGVFSAQAPDQIPLGSSFSYTTYFIVGQGDVGSVRDVYYGIRGAQTGRISAQIREEGTHLPVTDASLIVYKDGKPFSQYQVDANGQVIGKLEPGNYTAVAVCDNRSRLAPVSFTVVAGQSTQIAGGDPTMPYALAVPRNAILNVKVVEGPTGTHPNQVLPAKVTLVGTAPADPANDGQPPRKFLYDLQVGDRMLPTDLIPDDHSDPNTRKYVERVVLSDGTGLATGRVRPGTYHIVVSRGPEYALADLGDVTFAPGQVVSLGAVLNRVVDTTGYVSADFHVHSNNSIDGHIDLNTRVLSYAAEGLEVLTATDHNFVTDFRPNIAALSLQPYMRSVVGLEMTTLEMGHFNAFPLNYEADTITHGSFDWVNLPPTELFAALRAPPLGIVDGTGPDAKEVTVVEVNHPRDTILGYFHQFNVDQDMGVPLQGSLLTGSNGPAFTDPNTNNSTISYDFDAMEVFNGKRRELLRTFRMPSPRPDTSMLNIPTDWPEGAIVRTPCAKGTTCSDDVYRKQPVAFPGSVEDWFTLLNEAGKDASTLHPPDPSDPSNTALQLNKQTIKPVTATGNSDSHGLYFEEAGYPRNWLLVGKDEPRAVTDQDISAAVFNHKVVLSNGPFIDFSASAPGGSATAQVGGLLADSGDTVNVHIKVSAAPWVSVNRVTIYTNVTADLANENLPDAPRPQVITVNTSPDQVVRFDQVVPVALPGGQDGWIVVTVDGDASMFPILTPLEQPPLQISDAIAAIAGPLGLGGNAMGALQPATTSQAVPFAMTNPIWIDGNGDGQSFGRDTSVVSFLGSNQNALSSASTAKSAGRPAAKAPVIDEYTKHYRSSDLMKLFRAWGDGHPH